MRRLVHFSYFSHVSYRLPSWSLLIGVTLLSSACVSFQDIAPQATTMQPQALTPPPGVTIVDAAWPQADWWLAEGDAQLNQLMARALAANPTLATAKARLARAQAALQMSRAASKPQVGANANVSYGRLSENFEIPAPPVGPGGQFVGQGLATLDFSYELDVWGKNAALIDSAQAQYQAVAFDQAAARLALSTAVARTYAQLAMQYEQQDVLQALQKQRQTTQKLLMQRAAKGLDNSIDLQSAKTAVASTRAELAQLANNMDVTRLQLAALMGDMPQATQNMIRPTLSLLPLPIPGNLPLDFLARRPEVAAQHARVVAATGQAQAAKAQFYPNINLNALVGLQAIGLHNLLSTDSAMSSMGPAIHLPIFDAGRLRANYQAKTADIDEAVTQYNQLVVAAAQDVAEQLTRAANLAREEDATKQALSSSEHAHQLALLRYRAGLSSYLPVLTLEEQVLVQRRAVIDLQAKHRDLRIALVRALGGGFNTANEIAKTNETINTINTVDSRGNHE